MSTQSDAWNSVRRGLSVYTRFAGAILAPVLIAVVVWSGSQVEHAEDLCRLRIVELEVRTNKHLDDLREDIDHLRELVDDCAGELARCRDWLGRAQ